MEFYVCQKCFVTLDANKILYYYQNEKTGYANFVSGDTVAGTLPNGGSATLNTSDAFGTIANGYGSEVKRNSGQLIFLENRDPINRSSSQIEDIKLIVEFQKLEFKEE